MQFTVLDDDNDDTEYNTARRAAVVSTSTWVIGISAVLFRASTP